MVNVSFFINNRIGIRSIWKSFRMYSKVKGYTGIRSIGNFIISGNTRVSLGKNIRIINKGSFTLGVKIREFHVSTSPCIFEMGNNSTLVINGSCSVGPGVAIVLLNDAFLELGNNVYINSNSTMVCGTQIIIRDNTQISWNVEICDTDFHRIVREDSTISKPIDIGRNTLIGRRAMIMKGVKVGNGSVIAAGAVVTRDIPQNCLVAGVPARIIKRNITWK